jgi:hypothetical protein
MPRRPPRTRSAACSWPLPPTTPPSGRSRRSSPPIRSCKAQKDLADHPYYDGTKYRIFAATVWAPALATLTSDSGSSPSLLAAISRDLSDGYLRLQAKIAEIGTLKAQLATEEAALDRKDLSEADRQTHKSAVAALHTRIDSARDAVDPAKKAYVASCRTIAAGVPGDARDRFGVALVNLRQAVDDGRDANDAAFVRYPFLVAEVVSAPPKLKDVLLDVAKASASDYIFEQTGKRLKMGPPVKVGLTYENSKVDVTLDGFTADDLGKVQIDRMLIETIARTQRFAVEALLLLATTAATEETLAFEGDVLDAILGGLPTAGWTRPQPARIGAPEPTQARLGVSASSASPSPFSSLPFFGSK